MAVWSAVAIVALWSNVLRVGRCLLTQQLGTQPNSTRPFMMFADLLGQRFHDLLWWVFSVKYHRNIICFIIIHIMRRKFRFRITLFTIIVSAFATDQTSSFTRCFLAHGILSSCITTSAFSLLWVPDTLEWNTGRLYTIGYINLYINSPHSVREHLWALLVNSYLYLPKKVND